MQNFTEQKSTTTCQYLTGIVACKAAVTVPFSIFSVINFVNK